MSRHSGCTARHTQADWDLGLQSYIICIRQVKLTGAAAGTEWPSGSASARGGQTAKGYVAGWHWQSQSYEPSPTGSMRTGQRRFMPSQAAPVRT